MSNFDLDFLQRLQSRRSHKEDSEDAKRFPKILHPLVSGIFNVDDNRLIDIISKIENSQHIEDISLDLSRICPGRSSGYRGAEGYNKDFYDELSSKLVKCFNSLNEKGLDQEDKVQNSFRNGVELLFIQFDKLSLSLDLMKVIWEVVKTTTKKPILLQYLRLLYGTYSNCFMSERRLKSENQTKSLIKDKDKLEKQILKELDKCVEPILKLKQPESETKSEEFTLFSCSENFNEEQIIIFLVELTKHIDFKGKSNHRQALQTQIQKRILAFLQNSKPTILLKQVLKTRSMINITKLRQQILGCTFDSETKQYTPIPQGKYKNIQSYDNLLLSLQCERRNTIKYLVKQSVQIKGEKIYCKFTIQMLEEIQKQILKRQCMHSVPYVTNMQIILINLLDNQNKELVFVQGYKRAVSNVQYTCKIFQLFTKYLYLFFKPQDRDQIQNCYESMFANRLINQIKAWNSNKEHKKEKYFKNTLGDFYSYCAYYLHLFKEIRYELKDLLAKQSVELIYDQEDIPAHWRQIKHSRLLIENWAHDEQIQPEKIKKVCKIFLDSFFDESLQFDKDSYFNYIPSKIPNQKYRDFFAEYCLEKVLEFSKEFEQQKNLKSEDLIKYQKKYFIVNLILLGSIKLKTANQIAQIMYKVYGNYATKMPSLYALRTWISFEYKPSETKGVIEQLKRTEEAYSKVKVFSMNLTPKQFLAQQFPQRIEQRQQHKKNLENFFNESNILINHLELKNECQNYEKQFYNTIISKLINPLSDGVGELYHDSLAEITSSDEDKKQIKRLLAVNHFSEEKSIYQQLFSVMFSLKNIIRLYLCNTTLILNFKELRCISEEIGSIFQGIDDMNRKQQRTRIQLINDIVGFYTMNLRTHLKEKQTIIQSSAYSNSRGKIAHDIERRQSLISPNIIIPIYMKLKGKMPKLITLFTSFGRLDRQGKENNFNHHIASQNQLRQLIDYSKQVDDSIINTLIKHSQLLLKSLFLPKMNTDSQQIQKLAFWLYLKQFEEIFESQQCSDYIQDHIIKFMKIGKKSRGLNHIFDFEQRAEKDKGDQFLQFNEYQITPITKEDFKIKSRAIIQKFLENLPQKILTMNAIKFSLKDIFQVISDMNTNETGQSLEGSQVTFTSENLMMKLVSKLPEFLTQMIQQKKESNEVFTESPVRPGTFQNKKKKESINSSPLLMTFKILSNISRKDQQIMKQVFKQNIPFILLEYFKLTNQKPEILEICRFLIETLPALKKDLSESEKQTIKQYYKVVMSAQKLALKRFIVEPSLSLKKVYNDVAKFEQQGDFKKDIMGNVFKIFLENVKSNKPLRTVNQMLKDLLSSDEEFLERIIEIQIKAYILDYHNKTLIAFSANKQTTKSCPLLEKIQIDIRDYIKYFKSHIKRNEKLFFKVTNRIFVNVANNKQTLVYSSPIKFLQETNLKCYRESSHNPHHIQALKVYIEEVIQDIPVPKKQTKQEKEERQRKEKIEEEIIQNNSEQDQKKKEKIKNEKIEKMLQKQKISNQKKKFVGLKNILYEYKLLIPVLFNLKVNEEKGQDFLDWLIEKAVSTLQQKYIGLLSLSLKKNGLYLKDKIPYCHYVAARVMKWLFKKLEGSQKLEQFKNHKGIFVLLVCLGVKNFNDLASIALQQNSKETLFTIAQKQFIKMSKKQNEQTSSIQQTIQKILLSECLYMIHKHEQIKRFQAKNQLYYNTQSSQFIAPQLFFHHNSEMPACSFKKYAEHINLTLSSISSSIQFPSISYLPEMYSQCLLDEQMNNKLENKSQQNPNKFSLDVSSLNNQVLSKIYTKIVSGMSNERQLLRRTRRSRYDDDDDDDDSLVKDNRDITDVNKIWRVYYSNLKDIIKMDAEQKQNESDEDSEGSNDPFDGGQQKLFGEVSLRSRLEQEEQMIQHRQERQVRRNLALDSQRQPPLAISINVFMERLTIPLQNNKATEKKQAQKKEEKRIEEKKMQEKKILEDQELQKQLESLTLMQSKSRQSQISMKKKKSILNTGQEKMENSTKIYTILETLKLSKSEFDQLNIDEELIQQMDVDQLYGYVENIVATKVKSEPQKMEQTQNMEQSQQSVETATATEKQKQEARLMQNENYKLLASFTNYSQRSQFLIDTQEIFFTNLPHEVRDVIIRERNSLKRSSNIVANHQKRREQLRNNRDDEINEFRRTLRHRKKLKKKQQTVKYQRLSQKQEIQLSHESVIRILRNLLTFVEDNEINSGINLLLETDRDNISKKTLTTLIILLKSAQTIPLNSWKFEEIQNHKKWVFKGQQNNKNSKQAITNLKTKILLSIRSFVERSPFSIEKNFTQKCDFEYFSEVLDSIEPQSIPALFKKELEATEDSYIPINQIINISFDLQPKQSAFLIKITKHLPKVLIEKMFEKITKNQFDQQFYEYLAPFSQNQQLAKLFADKFSEENHPSFKILGKIIKYKFGQFPYIKKLQEKALRLYTPDNNEFIRQIFRYYEVQQIKSMSEQFIKYKQILSKIIEELYDEGKVLKDQPIYKLVELPSLLDFQTKRMIFNKQNKFEDQYHYDNDRTILLDIDIGDSFISSYNEIMSLTQEQIAKKYISVKYLGQGAAGGGIQKNWVTQVTKKMISPETYLFVPVNKQIHQPNPYAKKIHYPDHLNYFKFIGRFLALTIKQKNVIPAYFTPVFYKILLGKKPNLSDLNVINPELQTKINYLKVTRNQLKEDVSSYQYTFVYQGTDILNKPIQSQLIENGKNILVTNENMDQFIDLAFKAALIDFCSQQYENIAAGFNEIIPLQKLSIFSQKQLQLLISGIPEIKLNYLKQVTKYSSYDSNDDVIKWFWEYFAQSSDSQKANILQFITGTSRLTYQGAQKDKITIVKDPNPQNLPGSMMCFNKINLPCYPSKQELRKKMSFAILVAAYQGFEDS